jgi:hypothetical protein
LLAPAGLIIAVIWSRAAPFFATLFFMAPNGTPTALYRFRYFSGSARALLRVFPFPCRYGNAE